MSAAADTARRRAASRKGAVVRKTIAANRRQKYGPEGSQRGSGQVHFSIADTLARIRASQEE